MTPEQPRPKQPQSGASDKSRAQLRREARAAYRAKHGRGGPKGGAKRESAPEGEAETAEAPAAPKPPKHRAKHRLGQNFLADHTVIDKIVEASNLTKNDQVLEIGPGLGVLTKALAPEAGKVVAVELDRSLAEHLAPVVAENPNLTIIWQDFMKTRWEELPFEGDRPVKVVANIPYYITTPILMELLQAERLEKEPLVNVTPRAERILLMVQYEVAKRLIAKPGSKDFGSLTLIAQYSSEVSIVTKVPAGAFRPRPAVDSAVVMLRPRQTPPVDVKDVRMMFRAIRAAFQQRRKTLWNALQGGGFTKEHLEKAAGSMGLDLGRRAETLSLAEYAALANALSSDGTD